MKQLSNETKILLWASGSNDDVSNCRITDYTNLIDLIYFHRLQSRILKRIKDHKGELVWLTEKLKLKLMIMTSEEMENVKKFIIAFNELSKKLNSNRNNLYLIKGFSTYALTDSKFSRSMGDIDVFYNDHELLQTVASCLGYIVESGAGSHEDFYLYNRTNDIKVEIHKYFPVFRYPNNVKNKDFNPETNTGNWMQSGSQLKSAYENRIYYEDIKNNSISIKFNNLGNFLMADVNMAVIISCAHIFKDYVSQDTKRKFFSTFPKLRLSEIQDTLTLTNSPGFDIRVFEKLMEEFEASDCVELVHHLMINYYNFSPFSSVFGNDYRSRVNVSITNKLWVNEDSPFNAITMNDFKKRVESLGYSKIKISSKRKKVFYSYNNKNLGYLLTRSIVHSEFVNNYPFHLWCAEDEERLMLHIVFDEVPEDKWVTLKFILQDIEIVYRLFNGDIYEVSEEKVFKINFIKEGSVYVSLKIKSFHPELDNRKETHPIILEIGTKWLDEYTPAIFPMIVTS